MTRCKLIKTIAIALCLAMLTAGCGGNSATSEKPAASSADVSSETEEKKDTETKEEEPAEEPEKESSFSLKSSPDKYTQYVGKYVGMNAASVGYTSLGGDRMVKIGSGYLQITYVTPDMFESPVDCYDSQTISAAIATPMAFESPVDCYDSQT